MTYVAEKLKDTLQVVERRGNTLICICPVCGGDNLKINLSTYSNKYGAYKCWDNSCPSKEIRERSGLTLSTELFAEQTFSTSKVFEDFSGLKMDEPEYFDIIKEDLCRVHSNYQAPPLLPLHPASRLCYYYSDTKRVVRLQARKKIIIIQYWSMNGWVPGVNSDNWPLYLKGCNLNNKTLVFCEGEKTCEKIKYITGLAATTACASFFNTNCIYEQFIYLKNRSNIENILYIPDDDIPGYKKADIVKKACYMAGLRYRVKNIKRVNQNKKSGFDIADMPDSKIYNFIIDNDN